MQIYLQKGQKARWWPSSMAFVIFSAHLWQVRYVNINIDPTVLSNLAQIVQRR